MLPADVGVLICLFVRETALKYGLRVGPLADLRRPDPGDGRHRVDLVTKAAAHYLKDLYSTAAKASGLLVTASARSGSTSRVPILHEALASFAQTFHLADATLDRTTRARIGGVGQVVVN